MKPVAYITRESLERLSKAGESSRIVPVHAQPSRVAMYPLTLESDAAKYRTIALHFAMALDRAGKQPAHMSAMIAALAFEDARTWWGIQRPKGEEYFSIDPVGKNHV